MTIYHRVQGADLGATVYGSIKGAYELLLKIDPLTSIQALYKEEGGLTLATAPTKHLRDLPSDIMGLAKYAQICNAYTLSPAFGKDVDGNNKLQRPIWVFLRVKTTYMFSHLVGLIQPGLNLLNLSLKEKEMPYFKTKT
jgi:hypothetical protein